MTAYLSENTKSAGDTQATVCAALVNCHRATRLYPAEHPRVVHNVDDLREALAVHQRKTGRAFDLDSTSGGRDSSRNADALGRLRHMLRLNRIRRIRISPEVSCHEIVELCSVLDLDERANSQSDDDGQKERALVKTLSNCASIQATFFEFEARPRNVHPLGNLLESSGIHRAEEIDPILERFPDEHRKRIRAELTSPGFLLKVSLLRQALARSGDEIHDDDVDESEIDLVEEIVQATLPEDGTFHDVDVDAFVGRIKRFTELIEKNIEAFSGNVNSLPSIDRSLLRTHLRDAINATAALSGDVDVLQQQKQRLGFLFQSALEPEPTAKREDVSHEEGETTDSGQSAVDVSSQPEEAPAAADASSSGGADAVEISQAPSSAPMPSAAVSPPSERRPQIVPRRLEDPDEYRPANAHELYLFVVLDLIHGGELDTIRRRWPFIVTTLGAAMDRPELATSILRELCEFVTRSGSEEAEKLLFCLLEKLDHDALVDQFERALIPAGGLDSIRRFLEASLQSDFGGSISLVTRLHRPERARRLRELTHSVLIARVENPDLIVKWAANDVEDLIASDVIGTILEKLGADRIAALSREIVKRVPERSVIRLLRALPKGVEETQHVHFPALEHGSRDVRLAAIAGLGRCPFDVPIRTLIALLRGVKTKARWDEQEAETIITALVGVQHPMADRFLKEVLTERRLLFHVYPARLREAVSDILTLEGRAP